MEALRAFVEGGSVAQAAERLGRTPPQVGRLLAGLEAELGLALFSRHNRRLSLTPEGVRFHRQAERVLAGHDGLQRLAEELRSGRQADHVRVLAAPHMVRALMTPALLAMARRNPAFSASIDVRVRLDIESWVGQEAFDLGITVMPLVHPALEVEEFCRTEAVVVMPHGHPLATEAVITPAELVRHDLVATHPRSMLSQQVDQLFRAEPRKLRIRFVAPSGAVACELAAAGLGVALADPFVAQSSGATGFVMRRFRPAIALAYGLLFPSWQPRSAAASELAALIAGHGRRQAAMLARRISHRRSIRQAGRMSGA
nr:LysR family transcriptional regulator [Neoroseomonas soli]